MKISIEGDLSQIARLVFDEKETCWASKGSLLSVDPKIKWQIKIPGGVSGATRRAMSGEGVSLSFIEATDGNQEVRLSANQAGKIIVWNLEDGAVVTTRGSFVAAFGSEINIDVVVAKRTGAAFFGGAGIFLQKISGQGQVIVHGSGDLLDRKLQKNETLLVSSGNLAAFSETVDYNIEGVSGLRRIFFGGEGLFMTKLTGPGRIVLQTMKRITRRAST